MTQYNVEQNGAAVSVVTLDKADAEELAACLKDSDPSQDPVVVEAGRSDQRPETWPLVEEEDFGIRPGGPPDECFYCQRKVGEEHEKSCVVIVKKVRLRYIFVVDVYEPHGSDKEMIVFHRNESSWCASNALDELELHDDQERCLCDRMVCEFVETLDDVPRRAGDSLEGSLDHHAAKPNDAKGEK